MATATGMRMLAALGLHSSWQPGSLATLGLCQRHLSTRQHGSLPTLACEESLLPAGTVVHRDHTGDCVECQPEASKPEAIRIG